MTYTAIIIDDEKMARNLLQGMIQSLCPEVQVLALCEDLPNGVKAIRKLKPNLVFLDIEMPGHSGLELLDFFDDDEINFSIIFTTAYHQYAVQAFKLSAVDYLLKPIEPQELEEAIARYTRNKQQRKESYQALKQNLQPSSNGAYLNKKVALPSNHTIKFVEMNDIIFFKANGAYTNVVLKNQPTVIVSKSLKHFEDSLDGQKQFFRCHKSYMININFVSDYVRSEGGYIVLDHEHKISLSIDRIDDFLDLMSKVH